MPNLLLDQTLWEAVDASFDTGQCTFNIGGTYAVHPSGSIQLIDSIPADATLRANCTVTLGGEVYPTPNFFIESNGDILFTHSLVDGGTFTFDIPLTDYLNGSLHIYADSPYGYESFGNVIVVPIADVPEEPGENGTSPWWLCDTKPTVTPCPVRPQGFVPFNEYDADFTYPLASSRVPMKLDSTSSENCVPCNPVTTDDP